MCNLAIACRQVSDNTDSNNNGSDDSRSVSTMLDKFSVPDALHSARTRSTLFSRRFGTIHWCGYSNPL